MTSPIRSIPARHPNRSHGSMIKRLCDRHGPYFAELYGQAGSRKIYSPCPICAKNYEREQKARLHAEETARQEVLKNNIRSRCGIPKRFAKSTLDQFRASTREQQIALNVTRKYLANFESNRNNGCSLVFCGTPGTGKTMLACAIANRLLENLIEVKYSSAYAITRMVKSTYRKDSNVTEKSVIDSFIRPALLVLDEVGVQFGSETDDLILYQIINGRYEAVLPTILISNMTEKELAAFIGDRCIDRMREGGGAVVSFDWDSYRK